jgi:hypothetical protein
MQETKIESIFLLSAENVLSFSVILYNLSVGIGNANHVLSHNQRGKKKTSLSCFKFQLIFIFSRGIIKCAECQEETQKEAVSMSSYFYLRNIFDLFLGIN